MQNAKCEIDILEITSVLIKKYIFIVKQLGEG